jgi:hypothetical protein
VLDEVVRQMDEINKTGGFPDGADIARSTGLEVLDIAAALDALEGEYLSLQRTSGGPEGWFVTGVASAARREVGQWPMGEIFIERLAGGIAEAAEQEADPERKSRLQMDVPLMLYITIRRRRSLPLPGWVVPVLILGVAASVAVKTAYDDQIRRLWKEIREDWLEHERLLDEDPRNGQIT